MPIFGSHLSVAGGPHKAVESTVKLGFDTVQIFTKNASQWQGKPLTDDTVATFRAAVEDTDLRDLTAHDSYLINLASPDDAMYRKSIEAFAGEMERAERLGLAYLVAHPGAHLGEGEEAGIERIASALDEILSRCDGFTVMPLLETTAGQGTTIGHEFAHIGSIIRQTSRGDRLGVCFDTCHAVAAGYAMESPADYRRTWAEFDREIGIGRLRAFHVNDSRKPLGSRVDRHAHIGEGHVGLGTFRQLVTDRRFRDTPMILETPKEDRDGVPMDAINLALLKDLSGKRSKIA